jgi:hypothetical protein
MGEVNGMKKYWLVIGGIIFACCIGLVSAQAEGGTNGITNASITVTDQMVEGVVPYETTDTQLC